MTPAIVMMLGLGFVVLLVLLWLVALYNGLVRSRNGCDESWADIDTELRRRYDLVPNLVETVKGYAAHEKETLERVMKARNAAVAAPAASPAAMGQSQNELAGSLRQLFAVAENYPQLKANENFLKLQSELANTEDRIQRSRRFYNANVRDLNNRVDVFPSSVVANTAGIRKREYFEIDEPAARQPVAVKF